MVMVYSKALNKSIKVDRFIGHHKGKEPGPTLIFIGGMHGNEPSGVFALQQVLQEIIENDLNVKGNIYALSGNLWALEKGERYHKQDLNRLWTKETIAKLLRGELKPENEDIAQQMELYHTIEEILHTEKGPFYFMDLHSTSGKTIPFALLNDSLLNRKFVAQYPIPLVLGIEEYLEGPLLSYINEMGYVAFGYESGQHDEFMAIQNHIAFIYLTTVFAGSIAEKEIDYQGYFEMLAKTSTDKRDFYEIFHRHRIKKRERFSMLPGYINFQQLSKGEKVAISNGEEILATKKGRIFMPLYQHQGAEGFFNIRRIPSFFLLLSSALRKIHLDAILPILPGVKWLLPDRDGLMVDKRVARFFSKQFFHLLGYRSREVDQRYMIIKNRERKSRKKEYINAPWNHSYRPVRQSVK
ncbi:MAG: succinylglutamate desuccinylase/aspartoacylase family protein [Saonia sp.]